MKVTGFWDKVTEAMLIDRVSGPLPENIRIMLSRRIDRAFDAKRSTPPAVRDDPDPIFPEENPYPWRIFWTDVDELFIDQNHESLFFISDDQRAYYIPAFLRLWINDPWSQKLEQGHYDFFLLMWLSPSFDNENGRLICSLPPKCFNLTEDQTRVIAMVFFHLWNHSSQSLRLENHFIDKIAEFDQDIESFLSNKEDKYRYFRPKYDLTWALAFYWHRHLPTRLRRNRVLAELVVQAERRVEFREKAPQKNLRKR